MKIPDKTKFIVRIVAVMGYTFLNLKIILPIWNGPSGIWRAAILREDISSNGGFILFSVILGLFLNVIVVLYFLKKD